jgi:hypothetical protein
MADSKFPVLLFYERGLDRSHAEQVEMWFNRFPGPVTVTVVDKKVRLPLTDQGVLLWDSIFEQLTELRIEANAPADTFVYLLTKSPNELNWFATEDEEQMRNAFGHIDDFSWVTTAPPSVIASHYILKTIFNVIVSEAGIPWETLWHKTARGCFYDFCDNKWQVNLKLRTADICGDCMEAFKSIGVPDALFRQTLSIMEASRRLALNTSQFLVPDPSFLKWPFPVAVTRHKVVQASNQLLRFLLLLDHFDSLVRYSFLVRQIQAGQQPVIADRPSLGWWVSEMARSFGGDADLKRVVSIAEREKVVHLRNERRGHGWMSVNEDAYRDDSTHLEAVLSRIEAEMEPFLLSHQLVIPREFKVRSGGYEVNGDHLTGSHLLHPLFSCRLESDPVSCGIAGLDEVYVTDAQMREFKLISPHIRAAVCPECRHPRILITDGGRQYIDVFVGHRVEL